MRKVLFIFFLAISKLSLGQKYFNENLFYFKDTLTDFSTKTKYTGSYTSYYPGHIKFKGDFVNGVKQGKFVYYRDPEKLSNIQGLTDSIVTYFNGVPEGEKLIYFNNIAIDLLKERLHYTNGKLNGLCYYWDNTFQLAKISNYYDGYLIDEKTLETDSTIEEIAITLKEFPDNTVDVEKLTDSLTLEIVGLVPDYSQKGYKFKQKPLLNFSIKSYVVLRHTNYQVYETKKFSSSVFKSAGKCGDCGVSIRNLILIDKNSVEYEIPKIVFKIK